LRHKTDRWFERWLHTIYYLWLCITFKSAE